MENITKTLKQGRIDKGYTVDELVERTKFTKAQINAIENGNLEFFKRDLSYFSYVIRYYCNALDIDYEILRSDVEAIVAQDTFTQEIEVIHRNNHADENNRKEEKLEKKSLKKKKKKKIDYSFAAFITTSVIFVLILVYVGAKYIPTWFKEDPVKKPGLIVKPEEPKDEEETPPKVETPKFELKATQDPNKYEIVGWQEDESVEIKVVFKAPATWISASVNNVVLSEPVSKTYLKDEEIIVLEKTSENKEIMFHFGKMLGNEVYINNERVDLDDTVQNSAGVVKLYFKFIKDGTEA